MGEFALGSESTGLCLLKLSTSIELSVTSATSAPSPFTKTKSSSKWLAPLPQCRWSHIVICNGYAASGDKQMQGLVIQRFDIKEEGDEQ